MTEENFLKKLNVIYAEDSRTVREETSDYLKEIVNEVYTASNGQEALEIYQTLKNKVRVDLIISDIDMPILDGIGLLKNVREENIDLPFIFLSSHGTNVRYLIDALKYNISSFLSKPVDFRKLQRNISRACHSYHRLNTIKNQKEELEKYLNAIHDVAIVSRTNTKGIITYVNPIFCNISKYTQKELIGKNHNIVRHEDISSSIYKNLWNTVKSGHTWQGKIKNKAKDGSAYHVNATIMPIYDDFGDEIIEYIGIRFLTTEEEVEKREFKKKVIQNLQINKKKEFEKNNQIKLLETELILTKKTINSNQNYISKLVNKTNLLINQVKISEEQIKKTEDKNRTIVSRANLKVKESAQNISKIKNRNNILESQLKNIKEDNQSKEEKILELENKLSRRLSEIEKLNDEIRLKDIEIKKLNEHIEDSTQSNKLKEKKKSSWEKLKIS